jgi:hypothetical protein
MTQAQKRTLTISLSPEVIQKARAWGVLVRDSRGTPSVLRVQTVAADV